MLNHRTVMIEARHFICPRESCKHEWLCYRWKDYVQCPICHATITLNPVRPPRASYNKNKESISAVQVQKGKADQTPLVNPMMKQAQPHTQKRMDDCDR